MKDKTPLGVRLLAQSLSSAPAPIRTKKTNPLTVLFAIALGIVIGAAILAIATAR